MAKVYRSRRGRCPHRPETLRVGPVGINVLPSHRTSGTMRASSPTRWESFSIHRAPFFTFGGPLHTRPCGATLSKQERAGDSYRRGVPLPSPGGRWLGAAETEEGRYQVGSAYRPTPVTPTACHPLPGEGKGVLHLSQERVRGFFEIPRKKPFTFGNTYVRISPLVMASITFVPSAQLREKTQGGISPNPILS